MLSDKQISFPAYTISNENQRWATKAIPNVNKVLTVAGSGDQALFYKLAGAKIIDTFDITPNAIAIQDIKFAAINVLSRQNYKDLLVELYHTNQITSIPQMRQLNPVLSKRARFIIATQKLQRMFCAGLDANAYPDNIPTNDEYNQLKTMVDKPLKFIETDLEYLPEKLTTKYDVINISNIFDYHYDAKTQAFILANLADHLNVGGRIVYLPQYQKFDYHRVHINHPTHAELIYERTITLDKNAMILFQRIR